MQGDRITLICNHCDASFQVHPYRAGIARYCSPACYWKAKRIHLARACEVCGASFTPVGTQLKAGGGRYCSRACMGIANSRQVARICAWCKAPFTARISTVRVGGAQFCSRPCLYASMTGDTERRDRASHAYKTWRRAVYRRDQYTCQQCGQVGGSLHAHHIQPWAAAPDLRLEVSNGQTLCKACHRRAHQT